MHRLHGIRQTFGIVIATYTDEPMAHTPITAEEAKADFLGRCDRTIRDLEQTLREWKEARAATEKLTEADFEPYGRHLRAAEAQ